MSGWCKKAEVPPVCRSGYLLVVFGEVSEKSPGLSQKSPSLSTAYFRLHKMSLHALSLSLCAFSASRH